MRLLLGYDLVFDRTIICDERFKFNSFLKSATEIITVVQLESAILMISRLFTLPQEMSRLRYTSILSTQTHLKLPQMPPNTCSANQGHNFVSRIWRLHNGNIAPLQHFLGPPSTPLNLIPPLATLKILDSDIHPSTASPPHYLGRH